MRYIVKSVVCDYGVFKKTDNEEKLIEICNSLSNAELIADILNTDLRNAKYEVIELSKVNKAIKKIETLDKYEMERFSEDAMYHRALKKFLEIFKRNIGE